MWDRRGSGGNQVIRDTLERVVNGVDLSKEEARAVMEEIMSGRATPAQISAFITALRMKGETVEEIAGCAQVMREKVKKVRVPDPDSTVDTCGTGGDRSFTFNISTASALVTAGAGVTVAKHGNRSVSSGCGSADVLEYLGVNIQAPLEVLEKCLSTVGFGFLFAPLLHPAMKYAIVPRGEIGIRTIFNILGPLTNPAGARRQVLGVYASELTETLAGVLRELGALKALVLRSEDGLDEISPCAPTRAVLLEGRRLSEIIIDPKYFGITHESLHPMKVASKEESATILRSVLEGEKGIARDAVLLNASAGIMVSGRVSTLAEGMELALESIDSGKALQVLERLIEITKS